MGNRVRKRSAAVTLVLAGNATLSGCGSPVEQRDAYATQAAWRMRRSRPCSSSTPMARARGIRPAPHRPPGGEGFVYQSVRRCPPSTAATR